VTEDAPIPGAAEMRLGPKERLEILKERARQRRDQALANAKIERTKLWLTRTPAGVAKYQWLIDALDSDDPTTRELAEAELSRLQAPGRRADTAETRLDQQYQMHRERLDQRLDELDQRLRAAKDQGDARAEAALTRLRERIAARRDELEFLESGRDYRKELGVEGRRGTGTSDSADMKVDDALAKLKELRAKPYFPGQAAEKLDRVEQLITQAKKQERSHVGPVITKQLKRLELQLNRAERREGVRPQPQTPLKPPPGRQSSTSSATPAAASRQSTPGPSPKMVDAYAEYFRQMTPEEAEVDLKADMADDPALTARGIPSPRTLAKQQAYSRVFPDRPLTLRLPAADTPPQAGPAPQPTTPGQASTPPVPTPQPPAPTPAAPTPTPTAPRTERTAPATTPPTPQAAPQPTPQTPRAQALMKRLVEYYTPLSDQDLEREAARVSRSDPTGMDVGTQYRLRAIEQVRNARQGPGGPLDPATGLPASPASSSQRPPQGMGEHTRWVEQYRSLDNKALHEEATRVLRSDPLARTADTNSKLTALNQLMDERKAAKPHGDYVNEDTLQRYQGEVKDWSTAKLLEESHTMRGAIAGTLGNLTQLKPEAFAAASKFLAWAREAEVAGGAVASFPSAGAGLAFIAPLAWGLALKSLSEAFPDAGAYLQDLYHRQLAIGLELHARQGRKDTPATPAPDEEP
jgi:hypothetical protein